MGNPINRFPGQSEREEILEQEETRKALDGEVSVCVDEVQGTGGGTEDHTHYLHAKEKGGEVRAVFAGVVAGEAEAEEADHAEHRLGDYEEDPEFRLVDAVVALGESFGGPVGEQARDEEA